MREVSVKLLTGFLALFLWCVGVASAAYHHMGESDAPRLTDVYPGKAGTKLDNCVLCHSGGSFVSLGKTVNLGSCQWCHYRYGYDGKGDIKATLNRYGRDYRDNGRSEAALKAIEGVDSDGDGYSNREEIAANRYPGDSKDDPAKVTAPFRIYTKNMLQAMPQHSQFLLMNTSKSGDYYTEFSGVIVRDLLENAGIDPGATKITVYSPDGYSQGHPLEADNSEDPYVNGTYPPASYFYNSEADRAVSSCGWCDYGAPGNAGRGHGDPISVKNGLRLLLALRADGKDLSPGVLGQDNKLLKNGNGPFWVVAPQKKVGPPDQPSSNPARGKIWPYDFSLDHNAGYSTKCATIIKVEPLPAGTTDIDVMEAGWKYIDQGKIVIYGALQGPRQISPRDNATGVPWQPVTFRWEKSPSVEAGDIVSYRVEYSDKDPSQREWEVRVTPADASAMAAASVSIVLKPGRRYWWRVGDLDKNGGSTMGPVNTFVTGRLSAGKGVKSGE
jgi:hypothetical protein